MFSQCKICQMLRPFISRPLYPLESFRSWKICQLKTKYNKVAHTNLLCCTLISVSMKIISHIKKKKKKVITHRFVVTIWFLPFETNYLLCWNFLMLPVHYKVAYACKRRIGNGLHFNMLSRVLT